MYNLIKNLKISAKILSGFIIVLILILIMGILSITNLNKINSSYMNLYNTHVKSFILIGQVSDYFQKQRVNYRNVLIARNSVEMNNYIQQTDEITNKFKAALEEYSRLIDKEDIRKEYQNLSSLMSEYESLTNQIIDLAKKDKNAELTYCSNQVQLNL